jgi:subtilisin family serine protease
MSKRLIVILVVVLLLAFSVPVPASPAPLWQLKIDPWVLQTAQGGETEFLVFLEEQADLSGAAALPSKAEKGSYVYQKLTEVAGRTQPTLLAALRGMGVAFQPFWVANMVWVRGDQAVIQALAQRPDVAHLYANPAVRLEPSITLPAAPHAAETADTVEWNIQKIRADKVWALGYTGQGVVIGGQDTGYDWTHPALRGQYRGWDGVSAHHDHNWHDAIHEDNPNSQGVNICGFDSSVPCDDRGHGTHTMGIMLGDDGAGHQIGVAPGARWIGCRNMENNWGTPATYAECYQWFIAPTDLGGGDPSPALAPDVINNSWSCPVSEGCTNPNVLLTAVENVRLAGILTVHSAGNSGSGCSTISAPAAIYQASFTVGATTSSDTIASFSSRGPVTADGSNRLKPDVAAPGVGVNSSLPGGGYGSLTGTSMAAPHVAGLAALLISVDPSLRGQVDRLEALIERTALPHTTTQTCGGVPGSSIPNNAYGWGRVDAFRAATWFVNPFFFPIISR